MTPPSGGRRPLAGRHVVVGVSGSIAAYKAVTLVRRLIDAGATVDVAMTHSATQFVGPLTFATLTQRPVLDDALQLDPLGRIAHVEVALAADVVVLAPATVHLIGQLAAGLAPDAVTAIVAASRAPIVVAPAMDAGMWAHPATQRNVETLRGFGYRVIEPGVGALASGLSGQGRLAEPEEIAAAVERLLARGGRLDGLRVVVTAGGTQEPIDAVRFIGNRSTGRMGVALAETARDRGADVVLIAGAMSVAPPRGIRVVEATTTTAMREEVLAAAPQSDVLVMAAAVADFAPARRRADKIKRGEASIGIELVPNPDIVAEVGGFPAEGRPFIVGFAAETDDLIARAQAKLREKRLDLIIANPVGGVDSAIGAEVNRVSVIAPEGEIAAWPSLPKRQVAERLWDLIGDRYVDRREGDRRGEGEPLGAAEEG